MSLTTYKRKVKLATASKEISSLKELKKMFLGKDVNVDENVDTIPSQCGAKFVYDLNEDTKTDEIICFLLGLFYNEDGDRLIAQIIFSDTVDEDGKKNWKDVKANCHKGPISVNPNTDTRIQFYIVVPQDLVAAYNAQFK